MDRYLITGGTGFFGFNFLNYLNENIFLLGHKKKFLKKNPQIVFLKILNKKNLTNFIRENNINTVVHAAAITDLEYAEKNKLVTYNTNVKFTKIISDICKILNLKLIFISTDQLYNSINPSKEINKIFKLNYYASTKYLAEEYIKKNNKKYWIIRCSFFGWGSKYKSSLADFIIKNLQKKNKISLWKNVYFNPIYVSELIEIVLSISKNPIGIYNVGSSETISKLTFGKYIAKAMSLDLRFIQETNYNDLIVKRPRNMSVNIDKIKKFYGNKNFSIFHQISLMKNDRKKIIDQLKFFK